MIKIIFRILIILITGLLFLYKCVEPFQPEIEKYEDLLVIDGFISNENIGYEVALSRTSSIKERYQSNVSDAIVKIIDNKGNEIQLTESNRYPGKYISEAGEYIGEIGNSYKLYVKIENKEYETDFELMTKVAGIDSLYYDFFSDTKIHNNREVYVEGLTLKIDASGDNDVSDYIFWEYIETWKIDVPFETLKTLNKQICYVKNKSQEFLFSSLGNFKNKDLKNVDLYSIDNISNRLTLTYSTQIKQYGINEKAFQYYKNQKAQKENVGSLFDKTPIAIIGNIKCISNPEEPVLGLFRVAAMNSKRIFIYNKDIEDKVDAFVDVEGCNVETYDINIEASDIQGALTRGLVIMDTIKPSQSLLVRLVTTPLCFDCTFGGGVTTPPDFWVEKYEDK